MGMLVISFGVCLCNVYDVNCLCLYNAHMDSCQMTANCMIDSDSDFKFVSAYGLQTTLNREKWQGAMSLCVCL